MNVGMVFKVYDAALVSQMLKDVGMSTETCKSVDLQVSIY